MRCIRFGHPSAGRHAGPGLPGGPAFATPEGTRRLTDITHPAIIRELLDGVAAAQSTGVPFVFVDGAVIVGEAFEQYCDAIIVVTAPEREAVSRIVLRDGISKQAARMRLRHRRRRTYCVLRQIIS